MADPVVRCDVENAIATVTLDSPPNRNALSRALVADLHAALDRAEQPDVRIVVLTHTGNTFCVGADLKERLEGPVDSTPMARAFRRLMQSSQPTIAAVNGAVRAGGIGLMAACDLVVVQTGVDFAFTEVRIGAVPAMISVPILRRCTASSLTAAFLTGEPFDAARASEIGLVTHVADDVGSQVRALCDGLLKASPSAVTATKEILRSVPGEDVDTALARMQRLSEQFFESDDAAEGMRVLRQASPGVGPGHRMSDERGTRPIRIANCSGFYGDRITAAREMVEGGPIDVLTGDYLAELTMLILWKARERDATAGFANTFIRQVEDVLGTCIERGIRIVTNAGGLNPAGCAEAVRTVAARLGLAVDVAHIEGDDLMPQIEALRPALNHLDTGEAFTADPVSANAYLGGFGIARALAEGAEVVVCPRVTDAALVVGPAAWWWDWQPTDWHALAGAVVAGHIIECGPQTVGGNFTFFEELPSLASKPLGFPIAEVSANGDSVITKHPDTGGAVTVDTVTAQLVYEIGSTRYANPDVITRFDTIHLVQEGPDRVLVSGTLGEPAPPTTKVCINIDGGYRNRMTFVLTGLRQPEKAAWARAALFQSLGGEDRFDEADVRFVPAPSDAPTQEQASGRLHVSVRSADERLVGRAFSSAAVELVLANYPGFFLTSTPGAAQSIGEYWPALVPASAVDQRVVLQSGRQIRIEAADQASAAPATPPLQPDAEPVGPPSGQPLGSRFGARSGDKGGNANVGIWARDDGGYVWLRDNLDEAAIHRLLPEAEGLTVHRYELPNLRALNFVIVGYLGRGVSSNNSFDPQAKGLGEYLLSRIL